MNKLIIHTTGSFKKLNSILNTKSFKLSFSSENFTWKSKDVSKAAHPMVCFSEYDTKTINSKRITYGLYSIGFRKEWARKNCIGPVLYVSDSSVAAKGMRELLVARRNKKLELALPPKLRLAIMEIKCFMKNEIGFNSYTGEKNFDFKSENEWRYVPQKNLIDNFFISENQNTYKRNKEKYNKIIEKYPLKFKLSDIEVLYVPSQKEKNELSNMTQINKSKIKISKWRT